MVNIFHSSHSGILSPPSNKHSVAVFVPLLVTHVLFTSLQGAYSGTDGNSQQLSRRLAGQLSCVPGWSTCQLCFLLNATSGSEPSSVFRGLGTLLLFLSTIDPPAPHLSQGTTHYKTIIASSSTGRWLRNTNTGCYHNGSDPGSRY